ncbi:MAG: hypothetical protein IJ179_03265 [Oscillospiraceae bacterium]|nr:hypothetical protein [Oscillospiraceae bacterium]
MAEKNKKYTPRHLPPEPPRAARATARPGKKPTARGGAGYEPARPTKARAAAGNSKPAGKAAAEKASRQSRAQAASQRKATENTLFHQSLLPTVEHVHRMDQRGLRVGVIWLLVLPVLLLVIRRLTDSSKVAFLIIWIIGMFIIAAALIFVAYADHELKRFLEDAKQYVPEASETELDKLLPSPAEAVRGMDADSLPVAPEVLRGMLARRRERREAGMSAEAVTPEEAARLRLIEDWLQRLEQRRGKETENAEHKADHKG